MSRNFLFIFISICFFVSHLHTSHADLYTPVRINIGAKDLEEVFNKTFSKDIKIRKQLDFIPKFDGLDLKSESITYYATFKPKFEIHDDGSLMLKAKIKDLGFEIKNFDAVYKLRQNNGSVRVNVITKIACSMMRLSTTSSNHIQARGKISNKRPQLNSISFESKPKLGVSSQNCEAPKNYERELAKIANDWILSPEGQDTIISFLNKDVINDYWQSFKKGMPVGFMGRDIYLALTDLKVDSKFEAQVQIRWPDKSQFYLNKNYISAQSRLAYSRKDLIRVLSTWVPKDCFRFSFTRKELPSSEQIFNSRFAQFFAWSDLLNFSKDINFKLYLNVCMNKLDLKNFLKRGILLSHQSVILAQMNFVKNGKEFPYIVAWGKGQGDLILQSRSDEFQMSFANSKFSFQSRFHSKMHKWRGKQDVSGGPSMSLIIPRVTKALEKKPVVLSPNLSPALKSLNLKLDGKNIYLEAED